MNFDRKHYYNIGRLSKLLHVSKKTFYSKVMPLENFPEIIELTPTFKLIRKAEFDQFADWYHSVYKRVMSPGQEYRSENPLKPEKGATMNVDYAAKEAEYLFILKSLNECLSELIKENNDLEYCYRIQLEQYDLIVKDKDYVSEILESMKLE